MLGVVFTINLLSHSCAQITIIGFSHVTRNKIFLESLVVHYGVVHSGEAITTDSKSLIWFKSAYACSVLLNLFMV